MDTKDLITDVAKEKVGINFGDVELPQTPLNPDQTKAAIFSHFSKHGMIPIDARARRQRKRLGSSEVALRVSPRR